VIVVGDVRISKLPEDLHRKWRVAAVERGVSMKQMLIDWIKALPKKKGEVR